MCIAHLEIVKYLVENGANINIDGYALRKASEYGNLNVVRYLIEKGADICAEDCYAFILACRNGHLDVVRCFVDNDVDIAAGNNYCFRHGTPEIIEYLKSLKKN